LPSLKESLVSAHIDDVKKFSSKASDMAVASIVKYCGKALKSRDSALVAVSDPAELRRIKVGFASRKLGLSAEAADAGIKAVVAQMKGIRAKNRVTFYYLLAENTGTLDKLG
jgi:Protein of unknown function (DUF2853)